ncbi:zinc finger BED domain-containing protein 4-like [Bacillus rossius redtenbacheri]|uniref:zinc finger BED domain-containing protein 4-like n=1 Tax=Bacillus rossius redtenbacheri TaxID=93214 RepID=UPI002FDCB062
MLATDLLPYSFVEGDGFRNLMKEVAPQYQIPARTTFSTNYVTKLQQEVRSQLKAEFVHDMTSMSSLSLTTDAWTSKAGDSYVSITAHYLTSDFSYKSFLMDIINMNTSHTGQKIAEELSLSVNSWGITVTETTIPIYCVTDNGANFQLASRLLFGDKARVCFAHSLQLSIDHTYHECHGASNLLAKARQVVGHYRRSSKARESLHSQMEQMGQPVLEMIQHVDTRWSSDYSMLERLLQIKAPLVADQINTDSTEMLTSSEWKQMAGIVAILKPLADATREISGNLYPTSSMVIPMLKCLHSHLNDYIDKKADGVIFAKCLSKHLLAQFPNYIEDKVFLVAMIVDPRYKDAFVSKIVAQATLKAHIKHIARCEQHTTHNQKLGDPTTSASTSGLWSALDKLPNEDLQDSDCAQEIQTYLTEKRIHRTSDPWKWWENFGKTKFPNIANVALMYLSIPATQVASERCFSASGNIVTFKRQCLDPEHVKELVFLHCNLHNVDGKV